MERVETHGSLRRYLDSVYNSTHIYVWSEKVFIFADNALITVLNLPPRYRNAANGLAKKGEE